MKILNWNISFSKKLDAKLALIKKIIKKDSFILILQEVTLSTYGYLLGDFGPEHLAYSLKLRKQGQYDTVSRSLGIAIITSKDISIIERKVYERALLPERTLFVRVKKGNKEYKVLGLHSITGVDHKKAKSIQFYSFAEAIEELKPDIVGIDANEPNVDTNVKKKIVFHDNKDKGQGAKTFFQVLSDNSLIDHVKVHYKKPISKDYIIPSVKLSTGEYKRYDHLLVNFKIKSIKYFMDEALKAGSDYALVVIDKWLIL